MGGGSAQKHGRRSRAGLHLPILMHTACSSTPTSLPTIPSPLPPGEGPAALISYNSLPTLNLTHFLCLPCPAAYLEEGLQRETQRGTSLQSAWDKARKTLDQVLLDGDFDLVGALRRWFAQ